MGKIDTALKLVLTNRRGFAIIMLQKLFAWLPDEIYIKLLYRLYNVEKLNLDNPQSFTEKIQWLKLNNHNPQYTTMVDKAAVKAYVSARIGEEYIIPTIGVWDNFESIDFESLPNQFVLKTTHGGGGGGVVICKDKNTFDKTKAKAALLRSLKSNIYKDLREWPYKNVPKRIIAERYISSSNYAPSEELSDYKFYCFSGEPHFCQVIRNRRSKETIDFYDMNWNHQDFVGLNPVACNGLNPVACNGLNPVACPKNLEKMKQICRVLARDIEFVRVDLYYIDDFIYFGELTFYPNSGFGMFTPKDWNIRLGSLLTIPNTSLT